MGNPYRHPETGKMISKAEWLALTAGQPKAAQREPEQEPEFRYHDRGDGTFVAELTAEEHAAILERRRKADPFNQLPHALTDEGRAKIEAEKRAKGLISDGPRVEVTRDAHDNMMAKRVAATSGEIPEWEFPEVEQEMLQKYAEPGYRHRLLSPTVIRKRGMRKWDPVKDPETGDAVKFGNMTLARMPEGLAQARERAYQARAKEQVQEVVGAQVEAMRAVAATDPSAKVSPLDIGAKVKGDLVGMEVNRD